MKDKEKRIAAFIESLPITPNEVGTQSLIIPSDIGVVGEGINSQNCVNASREDCYNSKNGKNCQNFEVCGNAENYDLCWNGRESEIEKPLHPNK